MTMYNPPHPGEFITDIYLEPYGISGRELAAKLDVAASTLRTSTLTRLTRMTEVACLIFGDSQIKPTLVIATANTTHAFQNPGVSKCTS